MTETVAGGPKVKVKLEDLSFWQTLRARMANSPEAGALIGFAFVFLFFAITTPTFFTPASMASMLTKQSVQGIVAVGITFLMIAGEFDLSVGSILGVAGIVFGQLLIGEGLFDPLPIGIAFIAALGSGILLGLLNGVILVLTRIPSFIVTLGTLLAYRALALTATSETGILRLPPELRENPPLFFFSPWVIAVIALGLTILFAALTFIFVRGRIRHLKANVLPLEKILAGFTGLIGGVITATLTIVFFMWFASIFLDFSAVIDIDFGNFNQPRTLVASYPSPEAIPEDATTAIFTFFSDGELIPKDMGSLIEVSAFDIMNGPLTFFRDAGIAGNFRSVTIWFLLVVIAVAFILNHTKYGNAVFATGGAGEAARAQGIPVDRVRIINFVVCGFLAAFAATLEFARQGSASGDRGTGWELEAIAAAVIGGSLLSGGYGSIYGTLIGVILAGMLSTGLVQLGVPAAGFRGYIGVILIVAVVINNLVRRQR